MGKESLARILVILFLLAAVSIPIGGKWLADFNQPRRIELHARTPEKGGWSLETIQAQAGQPIRLHITSDDVVHSFVLGQSDRPAVEILPGEYVDTTLTFDRPGKYTFYCDRWCGPNHWRMRGTIIVSGEGQPLPPDPQPLFLKLGIDIDSPQPAEMVPLNTVSAVRGSKFAPILPIYALDRETYLTSSPAKLWLRLRAEPALSGLSDADLWDVLAWIWQRQAATTVQAAAQALFRTNCAACHGETGQGNGVMVRGLPAWPPGGMDYHKSGEGLVSPPNFTDPKNLLGASPALLAGKIIRGGMGTGMPYWGPIFTDEQIDALVAYLYTFAWNARTPKP